MRYVSRGPSGAGNVPRGLVMWKPSVLGRPTDAGRVGEDRMTRAIKSHNDSLAVVDGGES